MYNLAFFSSYYHTSLPSR